MCYVTRVADSSRFGCQGGDDLFSESFWDLFQQLYFLFSPNFDFLVCNLCLFSAPLTPTCVLSTPRHNPNGSERFGADTLLGTLVVFPLSLQAQP